MCGAPILMLLSFSQSPANEPFIFFSTANQLPPYSPQTTTAAAVSQPFSPFTFFFTTLTFTSFLYKIFFSKASFKALKYFLLI
uniref:Candidate secreted effector n=1 Tax=Meloidogyne incognita TaxID=6306 RepID=A0A914LKG8_MELIC